MHDLEKKTFVSMIKNVFFFSFFFNIFYTTLSNLKFFWYARVVFVGYLVSTFYKVSLFCFVFCCCSLVDFLFCLLDWFLVLLQEFLFDFIPAPLDVFPRTCGYEVWDDRAFYALLVFFLNKFCAWFEIVCAFVFWETFWNWGLFKHLFENILFVEEQEDGSIFKGRVARNLFKQRQRFLHSVLCRVFKHHLIIASKIDDKQQCVDVVEAMNPFFPLISLTANINHFERNAILLILQLCNNDSCCSHTSHDAVFFCGSISFFAKTENVIKVAIEEQKQKKKWLK